VAQLEVRRPRERSGLRTDDTSYAKTIRKTRIYIVGCDVSLCDPRLFPASS
jgi:hypothetical protein